MLTACLKPVTNTTNQAFEVWQVSLDSSRFFHLRTYTSYTLCVLWYFDAVYIYSHREGREGSIPCFHPAILLGHYAFGTVFFQVTFPLYSADFPYARMRWYGTWTGSFRRCLFLGSLEYYTIVRIAIGRWWWRDGSRGGVLGFCWGCRPG